MLKIVADDYEIEFEYRDLHVTENADGLTLTATRLKPIEATAIAPGLDLEALLKGIDAAALATADLLR